jgi:hypothetical protein
LRACACPSVTRHYNPGVWKARRYRAPEPRILPDFAGCDIWPGASTIEVAGDATFFGLHVVDPSFVPRLGRSGAGRTRAMEHRVRQAGRKSDRSARGNGGGDYEELVRSRRTRFWGAIQSGWTRLRVHAVPPEVKHFPWVVASI